MWGSGRGIVAGAVAAETVVESETKRYMPFVLMYNCFLGTDKDNGVLCDSLEFIV